MQNFALSAGGAWRYHGETKKIFKTSAVNLVAKHKFALKSIVSGWTNNGFDPHFTVPGEILWKI